MTDDVGPFTLEENLSGISLRTRRDRLVPACMTESEVDFHIQQLKHALDRAGVRMKASINKRNPRKIEIDGLAQ